MGPDTLLLLDRSQHCYYMPGWATWATVCILVGVRDFEQGSLQINTYTLKRTMKGKNRALWESRSGGSSIDHGAREGLSEDVHSSRDFQRPERKTEENSKERKNGVSQGDTSLSVVLREEENVREEAQSPPTDWGVFPEGTRLQSGTNAGSTLWGWVRVLAF